MSQDEILTVVKRANKLLEWSSRPQEGEKMAGRPTVNKADTKAIRKLIKSSDIIDLRPVVAYVMRHSGCTWREIATTFGLSRQQAETIFKSISKK